MASRAAASAPSVTNAGLFLTSPAIIGVPSPPAPTTAPIVAVPMFITVDTRIPVIITGMAIGSSTFISRCRGEYPNPVAASTISEGMLFNPAMVFLTMGRILYKNKAIIVGLAPNPKTGIARASTAMGGKVCPRAVRSLTIPKKSFPAFLVTNIPMAIPAVIARNVEIETSFKCSAIRAGMDALGYITSFMDGKIK